MNNANRRWGVLGSLVLLLIGGNCIVAQDWPQWRGPNRDNKVTGFTAPQTWPKELMKKWNVKVGLGDASPALVGDKIYVFTRQDGDEVALCLDAGTGKELWQDKYPAQAVSGPAGSHPGPRSSPSVADGKVCTLGVSGVLSCLDAATGKVVWRKETKAWPNFFTASSPVIFEGKCIAFLGGRDKGEFVAYDLTSGEEKWKWAGEPPAWGSPALLTVDGTKQMVTPTMKSLVSIGTDDGKLLWQVAFAPRYNNGTPIIEGQTVFFSGQGQGLGTVALKIEKKGDIFSANEIWRKKEAAHQYNTPVLKEGLLFGLSAGAGGGRGGATNLYCMDAKTGEVLWTDKTNRGECGTVLDAGSVLLCLTSNSELVAFKPSNKGYEELAKYKVSEKSGLEGTWAYPIVSGNRVFVKDRDSLTLWSIE